MTEVWLRAALWLGLAFAATLISIRLRVATALSEIIVGTVAQLLIGAFVGTALLGTTESWITFLSATGAVFLTFLAGAELDPVLPAYLVGMVLAGTVGKDHALIRRLRTLTFGLGCSRRSTSSVRVRSYPYQPSWLRLAWHPLHRRWVPLPSANRRYDDCHSHPRRSRWVLPRRDGV